MYKMLLAVAAVGMLFFANMFFGLDPVVYDPYGTPEPPVPTGPSQVMPPEPRPEPYPDPLDVIVYSNVAKLSELCNVSFSYRGDYRNDLIKTIDGNYSQFSVYNEADALMSLVQIKKLIGINDPYKELVFERSSGGLDGEIIYDFDQYYEGIPVYGAGARVITDANGVPNWFTSSLVPDLKLDSTTPALSEKEASAAIKKLPAVRKVYKDMRLCVIADRDTDNVPTLAYSVTVDAETGIWNNPDATIVIDFLYIIDANTGELITKNQLTIID